MILQRFRDWRHERLIERLSQAFKMARARPDAVKAWAQLRDAINQRSAAQVERMERAKGLLR